MHLMLPVIDACCQLQDVYIEQYTAIDREDLCVFVICILYKMAIITTLFIVYIKKYLFKMTFQHDIETRFSFWQQNNNIINHNIFKLPIVY